MNIPRGVESLLEEVGQDTLNRLQIDRPTAGDCTVLLTFFSKLNHLLAAAPTPPAQGIPLPPDVLHALRFYANGEHLAIDEEAQEFDTVSGEPANWLHSQHEGDCTMIEDGSIAKAVLQGKHIDVDVDEPRSAPIEGEIYSRATPAQEDEPYAYALVANETHNTIIWARDKKVVEVCREKYPDGQFIELYTRPQSGKLRKAAQDGGEPLTRFCPSCGLVGEAGKQYRDCCPDGSDARMVPVQFAGKCQTLFKLAIGATPAPEVDLGASQCPPKQE